MGNPFYTHVVDRIKLALYVSVLHLVITIFSAFLEFGLVFHILSGNIDLRYFAEWFSDSLTNWFIQLKERLSDK